MAYVVRIGGRSGGVGEVFHRFEDAVDAAIGIAQARALDKDVSFYDLRSRGGACGVCPDGDEGGYWPIIEEVE